MYLSRQPGVIGGDARQRNKSRGRWESILTCSRISASTSILFFSLISSTSCLWWKFLPSSRFCHTSGSEQETQASLILHIFQSKSNVSFHFINTTHLSILIHFLQIGDWYKKYLFLSNTNEGFLSGLKVCQKMRRQHLQPSLFLL